MPRSMEAIREESPGRHAHSGYSVGLLLPLVNIVCLWRFGRSFPKAFNSYHATHAHFVSRMEETTTRGSFRWFTKRAALVILLVGYLPLGAIITGVFIPILVFKVARPINELIADLGDPNVKSGGEPAIVHAVRTGQHQLVADLIRAGVDITAKSSALPVAASNGDVTALRMLFTSGDRSRTFQ